MKPLTPKDVRLGNLTSHGVVVYIIENSFSVKADNEHWHNAHETEILPVPLTPEILEGFGLKRVHERMFANDVISVITSGKIESHELIIEDSKNGNVWHFYNQIHAHTLQNFVQAISGVELVYKPKTS
jgi:hypothetical protein